MRWAHQFHIRFKQNLLSCLRPSVDDGAGVSADDHFAHPYCESSFRDRPALRAGYVDEVRDWFRCRLDSISDYRVSVPKGSTASDTVSLKG